MAPPGAMALDPLGVTVPAQLRLVARPPALLVPCLGYNEHGYRLGYGGGFYDRTLAGGVRPATLGVAYACQLAAFDADVHDVPLDLIVTEDSALE
ncbi:5-formyltetrahydrofolate cyclo-ligase [Massilia sp. Dwa41.01b]|uniref:5-formyltetrahydrofolate cyclo-ligase n=1 Tax=Massilia sp. Dwa41.01b TaxID=2709302 RepID=UPI0028041DAF|nr:5-formyltetrahydrofolate cyclo-ligase [Massilia sp. Dwa41.01b]